MTGGSTWLPPLIALAHPEDVNAAAVAEGVTRATYMLENAASLSQEGSVGNLVVRVTNETGHKLPTGYPEGRRMWVNVQFYGAEDNLLSESGAYDPDTGVLTRDGEASWSVLDANGDFDNDGLSNLAEAAFGSDPHSASNRDQPTATRVEVDGTPYAAITYTRSLSANASISVEISNDLSNWVPADPSEIVEHSLVDNGDGTETCIIRMADPMNTEEPRFIRLRVE